MLATSEGHLRIPIKPDGPDMIFEQGRGHLKQINMIVPLFRKQVAFSRFIRTFEEVCLQPGDNVRLYIIVFLGESPDNESELALQETMSITEQLASRYGDKERIKVNSVRGKFARARALQYGMAQVESQDLLFFIDVDMVWTAKTLQRVRLNTKIGESVYFPVVFSEFDPAITYGQNVAPNHFLINDETGYWRVYGFGIMSAYKSDIERVRNKSEKPTFISYVIL